MTYYFGRYWSPCGGQVGPGEPCKTWRAKGYSKGLQQRATAKGYSKGLQQRATTHTPTSTLAKTAEPSSPRTTTAPAQKANNLPTLSADTRTARRGHKSVSRAYACTGIFLCVTEGILIFLYPLSAAARPPSAAVCSAAKAYVPWI